MGHYLIYDPQTRQNGGAAFAPNASIRDRDFTDGLSNTLCMSEVRAWQNRVQDATLSATAPATPAAVAGSVSGGAFSNTGHTEWVCGRALHIGFTTTFGPNSFVPFTANGQTVDVDVCSSREGNSATLPTYGVITSRSYHVGTVNSLLMDGSVRSVSNNIDLNTWQRLGQRSDGQVIGDF